MKVGNREVWEVGSVLYDMNTGEVVTGPDADAFWARVAERKRIAAINDRERKRKNEPETPHGIKSIVRRSSSGLAIIPGPIRTLKTLFTGFLPASLTLFLTDM
jgi:hypothetical protein